MDDFIRSYNKRLDRDLAIEKWINRIITGSLIYLLIVGCVSLTWLMYILFAYGLK